MKLREVYRSPKLYSVCESDRTDGLVLWVTAGGIMEYSIAVALLPRDIAEFKAEGHLDRLALEVAKNESRFRDRTLTPLEADEPLEFVDAF